MAKSKKRRLLTEGEHAGTYASQLQIVYDAYVNGPATVAEIAKRTGLDITQVKQVVHTLRNKGTIECLHSAPSYCLKLGAVRPTDRRGRKVV